MMCPTCGRFLEAGAIQHGVCPSCGSALSGVITPAAASPAESPVGFPLGGYAPPPAQQPATAPFAAPPASVTQPRPPLLAPLPEHKPRFRLPVGIIAIVLVAACVLGSGGLLAYNVISNFGVLYSSSMTGDVSTWPDDANCMGHSDGYHITASVACYPSQHLYQDDRKSPSQALGLKPQCLRRAGLAVALAAPSVVWYTCSTGRFVCGALSG